MRVKLFASSYIWDLEKIVNDWLKENEDRIIVIDTKFSSSESNYSNSYSICISYEELDNEN